MAAADLAEALDIPRNYMGKILHELGRLDIVNSVRGKHGGFSLAVDPRELPLLRVVAGFDRMGKQRKCLMGRLECDDSDPCPVHHKWKETARRIADFFQDTTVADVLASPQS